MSGPNGQAGFDAEHLFGAVEPCFDATQLFDVAINSKHISTRILS